MLARWHAVLSEAGMTLLGEAPGGGLQTSEGEFQHYQQQDDQDSTAISPRVEVLEQHQQQDDQDSTAISPRVEVLEQHQQQGDRDSTAVSPLVEVLNGDLLANILTYLHWSEVMNARAVCHVWQIAVLVTPVEELFVTKREIALDLRSIAAALPKLCKLKFDQGTRESQEFYVDDELFAYAEDFHELAHLKMSQTNLRASAPRIMQFKNLESLNLLWNTSLEWSLTDLSMLPKLKVLYCPQNRELTGSLENLHVLSRTLTTCNLHGCQKVTGNLKDLASMPVLEKLDVVGTQVTGDIREIGRSDFRSLKSLEVGTYVYGGGEIKRVIDAPSIMSARHQLKKQFPDVFTSTARLRLSQDSPERYDYRGHHTRLPPFWVEFVTFGRRTGWRWTNACASGDCEIHWLDPEPQAVDAGYEDYIKELGSRNTERFYKGFLVPPTQDEHRERDAEIRLDPWLRRSTRYGSQF
jgi:hypothetical protein